MASAKKNDDFNAWVQMEALKAQNMSPQSSMQMAEQATPNGIGGMSMPPPYLAANEPPAPAPPPPPARPTPVAPQKVKLSAQPTRQPLGTIPQEIMPQQDMGPGPVKKLSLAEEIDLAQKNYGEGLAMNQSEVDKMKEQLAQYQNSGRGIDFTPLAALLDTWYGGNLTQAAKAMAPESESQKQKNALEMQAKIAQAQRGISDQEREGIQQRLSQLGYEEQRKTAKEIAQINAAARNSGIIQERLLQKKAERMDTDVQKLEKRIGDIAPGIVTKLQNLESLVPGGINGDESGDVPGVGVGQFLVPDFMMSDEASDIQSNARGLAADLIKLQSGTAASDKEVDRKMKELGMAPGSKSSTFRSGLKRLKAQVEVELKNKEAGFRPEIKEAYRGRGGITHETVRGIGQKSAAPQGSGPGGNMSFDEWKKSRGK